MPLKMMLKVKKESQLICAIVIALIIAAGVVYWESGLTSPFYVFIMIVIVILLCLGLMVWQVRKSDVFPQMPTYSVFMIPLVFCLLAMPFVFFSDPGDLSLLLGSVFGLATGLHP